MASAVSNLLIYQGSDFIIDFTVENDNGTDFNLTGYTVACLIKKHYTSSTSQTVTAAVLSPVLEVITTSYTYRPLFIAAVCELFRDSCILPLVAGDKTAAVTVVDVLLV